jgi:hypothetical protein
MKPVGRSSVHAIPESFSAVSTLACVRAKRVGASGLAPITDSLTMCLTPASFAVSRKACSNSDCMGLIGDTRYAFSTPSSAGPSVRGSPRSPVVGSKPRSLRWCAFVSSRTSARASAPRALSARRTSIPVVPVAPVTSSIYSASICVLNSSLSSPR